VVLDALAKLPQGKICVVHAPRHLERVPFLMKSVETRFGKASLRSKGEGGFYVILDTYGELSEVYSVADVVVIGGGFEALGGQNILQPLAHGKPVIHGPHMDNFREVSDAARAAGATLVARDADELASELEKLLNDPDECGRMGKAASDFVSMNVGASRRYAEAISDAAKTSKALAKRK